MPSFSVPAGGTTYAAPDAAENCWDGARENPEVERERPAIDVTQIQLDPVVEIQMAAAADLPQARQPGPHAEAPHIGGPREARTSRSGSGRGPTSDMSPREHVEQLRQLVDRGAPQECVRPA